MSTSTAGLKASRTWSLPLPPRAGGTFEYSEIAKVGDAFISHVPNEAIVFVASCASGEVLDRPNLKKVFGAATAALNFVSTDAGWFGRLPDAEWKGYIVFWRPLDGAWRRVAICAGPWLTSDGKRAMALDGTRLLQFEPGGCCHAKEIALGRELRTSERPVLVGDRLFVMAHGDGNVRPTLVTIDVGRGRIESDKPMIGGLDEVPAFASSYKVIKAGGAAIHIMVLDVKGSSAGQFDLSWGAVGRVGAVIGNTLWLPMGGQCGLNSEPWRLDAFELPKGKRVASVPLSIRYCSWTALLPSDRLAVGGVGADVVDLKSKRSYKVAGLSKWGNAAVAGIGESIIAVHTREIACYELE